MATSYKIYYKQRLTEKSIESLPKQRITLVKTFKNLTILTKNITDIKTLCNIDKYWSRFRLDDSGKWVKLELRTR